METIRYYEREGLLPLPGRTAGNYRHYDAAQLERLQLIRRCRTLDMTHDEIRTLLGYRDQPERIAMPNVLIDEHIAHVRRRIAELVSLEQQLQTLRQHCHDKRTIRQCGISKIWRSHRHIASGEVNAAGQHLSGVHGHHLARHHDQRLNTISMPPRGQIPAAAMNPPSAISRSNGAAFLPATADAISRYLADYGGQLAFNTLKAAALRRWRSGTVEQGFP